jgi:hypothetical protein
LRGAVTAPFRLASKALTMKLASPPFASPPFASPPAAALPVAAARVTALGSPVVTEPEPGIETDEPCDLCDSGIRAGTAAAVLFYAESRGFAHAECIDELSRPSETARLI